MRQVDSSAHLLLVGEGPEQRALEQQAARLGVAGAVTFAGYVPQDRMAPYYRAADVFALPSEFDNSPNVVLEAMACGLPVVATDVGGVADYVVGDRGGSLVPRRRRRRAGGRPHSVAGRRRTPARGIGVQPPARPRALLLARERGTAAGGLSRGARPAPDERRGSRREGRDPRRRHLLLHGAGDARARLCRRVGSRAGVPGHRAVARSATSARAFRANTGTRANRSRWRRTVRWCRF